MIRVLLTLLVLTAMLPATATAQDLPKFPQQAHLATAAEVKAYWTRTLRWQCRTTRNRTFIEDKKRLIKRIELGLYDEQADLAAQRSNLAFLEFKERYVAAQKVRTRITLLEAGLLQRRLAALVAAPVPPGPAGGPAPVPRPPAPDQDPSAEFPDPEIIYVEASDDGADCPPQAAHRAPAGRPRHPLHPHRPQLQRKPPSPSLPVRDRQARPPVVKRPAPSHSAPPRSSRPASSPQPAAQPTPRATPPAAPSSIPGSRYLR